MERELRNQTVTRYLTPLREGGSLPALVEADDGFKYVLKFKGGGHGPKSLIAELIGGEIARTIGLKVPELVFLDVSEEFGRTEPDVEVQDLLKASRGLNLGLHFLSGALSLDAYSNPVDSLTASKIVWLDSFITNVDRTQRNTNMLVWHGEPWLIDHGASLYFQHSWLDPILAAKSPFNYIKDHVLIRKASMIEKAEEEIKNLLSDNEIDSIVDLLPDQWLEWEGNQLKVEEIKNVYRVFLKERLSNSQIFVNHVIETRKSII